MNKLFYILFFVLMESCSSDNIELFKITGSFVESLQTTVESYGILNGEEYKKITNDGKYQVMPFRRLVNVKILDVVSDDVYEDLKEDLKGHYEDDNRVNEVYINNGGTIMIDCRN
jgi:hypothetical protein